MISTNAKRSLISLEKFELNKTLVFDSHFHSKVMDFKQPISSSSAVVAAINTPDTDNELVPSAAFRSLSYHRHVSLPPHTWAVSYKECLKNHAAGIGGHALDGCGEFYPDEISDSSDPASLKCAACGCHRNFHRRDAPYETTTRAHTRLLLPVPPRYASASPDATPESPPPVSRVLPGGWFYGSNGTAPTQMLLALGDVAWAHAPRSGEKNKRVKKRARTKFSEEQKEKMWGFAEKIGWRMERRQDKAVEEFCFRVGIGRNVFKVWMHNNKVKRDRRNKLLCSVGASFDSNNADVENNNNNNVNDDDQQQQQRFYLSNNNGSSSSSP